MLLTVSSFHQNEKAYPSLDGDVSCTAYNTAYNTSQHLVCFKGFFIFHIMCIDHGHQKLMSVRKEHYLCKLIDKSPLYDHFRWQGEIFYSNMTLLLHSLLILLLVWILFCVRNRKPSLAVNIRYQCTVN